MAKNEKTKSNKEVLVISIISRVLLVLTLVIFYLAILLDTQNPEGNYIVYGIILAFLTMGLSLFLNNKVKGEKEVLNLEKQKGNYEKRELTVNSFKSYEIVEDTLKKEGLEKLSNGFYFKKAVSRGICYYVNMVKYQKLENNLEKELIKYNKFIGETCKKVSGVLFFELPEVKEIDKEIIKKLSIDYLLFEEAPIKKIERSIVVVLVDKTKNCAYYYDQADSFKARLYSYSALLVRKVFK
ncbi:MAG: hypothetical protein AB7S96_05615 [Candidatus Izemoplasmatales bacterium]